MPATPQEQLFQLALQHHQAGRLAEAETFYRQLLVQYPDHAPSLHMLGAMAGQSGKWEIATELISRAVALNAAEPVYQANLAKVLLRCGRNADAVLCLNRLIPTMPRSGEAYFDLGIALQNLGRVSEAIEAYQSAHRLLPNEPGILNNLGNMLRAMNRTAEAAELFNRALSLDPNRIEALGNLGQLLESQGRYAEAIALYQRALKVNPSHPTLHYNMGVSLQELNRLPDAIQFYQQALRVKPDYFEPLNNMANALTLLGRFDEAIDAFQAALRIQPAADTRPHGRAEAWSNLGVALLSCGRQAEAVAAHRHAMEIAPTAYIPHSKLAYTMIFLPEFRGEAIQAELARWNERHAAPLRTHILPHANPRDPNRRLRIGYVSPDFNDHVIARNLVPLFRHRDRSRFEVVCYSNVNVIDEMTSRFQRMADSWRDIRHVSDEQVANQMRADGIDILVDLTLHMARNRLPIFARKPAPIQVTFAGYPGSTGLEAIDYRLTDPWLDPPGLNDHLYVEKSIRLPHSFWCYDPLGEDAVPGELPFARTGRITFGCLNNFNKVNDPLLQLWAQVLAAVPNSRILILCGQGRHRQSILHRFAQLGIAANRIEFVASLPRRDYMRLYHQIDIVLDPVPYNGHTTSLDALWMGVPVVSLVGGTVVGRAGYSQLMNLGMPELIAHDPISYVRMAAELAGDIPHLQNLRAILRGRMEQSPLMDAPGFARGIEAAYIDMWREWCAS